MLLTGWSDEEQCRIKSAGLPTRTWQIQCSMAPAEASWHWWVQRQTVVPSSSQLHQWKESRVCWTGGKHEEAYVRRLKLWPFLYVSFRVIVLVKMLSLLLLHLSRKDLPQVIIFITTHSLSVSSCLFTYTRCQEIFFFYKTWVENIELPWSFKQEREWTCH